MKTVGELLAHAEQTPGGCWEWTRSKHRQGYGQLGDGLAHRLMYQAVYAVPDDQLDKIPAVRHVCDNPPCINPMHLQAGTQVENMQDYLIRGRERERRGNPHNAKLTEHMVKELRRRHSEGERVVDIAKEFGVARSGAYQALRGKTWKFVS